jgi:hypothetical protein
LASLSRRPPYHDICRRRQKTVAHRRGGPFLPSQARSRSRVFTYQLSAFVVALVTDPSCCPAWHTVHPRLVAVTRPRLRFTRIATLTTKSTALACRYPPTARKAGLWKKDRIRDLPTAQQLKRHADHSSMHSIDGACPLRVELGVIVLRPRQIACFPKLQLAHRIATPDQPPHPIFGTTSSRSLCMRITF